MMKKRKSPEVEEPFKIYQKARGIKMMLKTLTDVILTAAIKLLIYLFYLTSIRSKIILNGNLKKTGDRMTSVCRYGGEILL